MSKPMSMQPAKACQNGRGLWLYKRPLLRHISDFFSSATKILPRWLRWLGTRLAALRWCHSPLKRLSSRIGPLAALSSHFPVYPLPPSGDDLKEPHKRANSRALFQMLRRHCKTCRTPLHADDGHAECVSCLGKSRHLRWRSWREGIRAPARERNRRWLVSKLIDGFDLCDLSPLPHAAHPHCDHPQRCWPLKWDPDVAIVMREASSGMLSGRWKNHKWSPEECFEDIMERFETSSWEHLCGRPSPSAARVVSGCTLFSLSLSISMGFSLWKKQ